MTVSELYKSVSQLGFEDSLEDDSRFFYAANRALLQVCAIRPETRTYIIDHQSIENRIKTDSFSPITKTDELCFEASGVRSYYFEADGTGTVYIEKYENGGFVTVGMRELSAKRIFTPYKGFIKQDGAFTDGLVRLRFTGEFLYSVKNVAMYGYIYSSDESDIPDYGQYTRYDISTLAEDFLSLSSPPIKEDAEYMRLSSGYDIENGRVILLPYDARGIYKVIYNHRPTALVHEGEAETDGTVIDLDEELCSLLPMLIAAYVWADDEPEKAEYYLSMYRERAVDIERRIKDNAPVIIRSTNGW